MANQAMEFLSLFLLVGFSCIFIMPEFLSSLMCKIPIVISRQRRNLPCKKTIINILLECLCWCISLALALLLIFFLYDEGTQNSTKCILGVCCLIVGVTMTVYRIIELWRAEKREENISELEQKSRMPSSA